MKRLLLTSARIISPPPKRNAGQWADENRILPPESPEPGKWRTSRVPYTAAIYEAVTDNRYSTIVAVMGSQMSKTEAMLNIAGHRFDDGPYVPALYIGPTQKLVKSMSEDRFYKMLRSTPSLWEKLEKGHRDRTTEKFIAGVRFGFAWAGSAAELASHPAGLILLDERDRMSNDVEGEGDPVELADARRKNYHNSKMVIAGTVTIEGASPTWSLYESGTMGKWTWPCLHCSDSFIPRLELLKWPEGATPAEAAQKAFVVCPNCGGEIQDKWKSEMNARGFYTYHILKDPESREHIAVDYVPDSTTASFWVSGLASPWVKFGRVAEKLVAAYNSREQERIQTVVNTYGGELFRTKGDAPDWTEVMALRRTYLPDTKPPGVQLIVMGADVQKNGIYFVIRGYGFNSESWLLQHGFVAGETEYDDVWLLLARYRTNWQVNGVRIARCFIDSGYRPGDKFKRPENQVYKFCTLHRNWAFPTKGRESLDRPLKMSNIDVNQAGRVLKSGLKLWHLDTDHFKSAIHDRIGWPEDQPGGFHLHAHTDEDYCKQLTAEEVIVKPSGKRVWVTIRKDNHYLDCEMNALACAYSLQVQTLRPVDETEQKPEPAKVEQPIPLSQNLKTENSPGGFFSRYRDR